MTHEDFQAELEAMLAAAQAAHRKKENSFAGVVEYRRRLPLMVSRRAVQLYIAAIAQGAAHGYVGISDVKQGLYMAQLALQAFGPPSPVPNLPPVKREPGFTG